MKSSGRKTAKIRRENLEVIASVIAFLPEFQETFAESVQAGRGLDTFFSDIKGPLTKRRSEIIRLVGKRLGILDELLSVPLYSRRFHGALKEPPKDLKDAWALGFLLGGGRLVPLGAESIHEFGKVHSNEPGNTPEPSSAKRMGRQDWEIGLTCPTNEILVFLRTWLGMNPPKRDQPSRTIRLRSTSLGRDLLDCHRGEFTPALQSIAKSTAGPMEQTMGIGLFSGLLASCGSLRESPPSILLTFSTSAMAERFREFLLGLNGRLDALWKGGSILALCAPDDNPIAGKAFRSLLRSILRLDTSGEVLGTPSLPPKTLTWLLRLERLLSQNPTHGAETPGNGASRYPRKRMHMPTEVRTRAAQEFCRLELSDLRKRESWAEGKKIGDIPSQDREYILAKLNRTLNEWSESEGWAFKPLPMRTLTHIQLELLEAYLVRMDAESQCGRGQKVGSDWQDYYNYRNALGIEPGKPTLQGKSSTGRPTRMVRDLLIRMRCWACGVNPDQAG